MSNRSLRISAAAAASGAILIAASGVALGAPGSSASPETPDRASLAQNNGRGNGGNGGNGGGRPGGNPIITPPVAPATPVAPPITRPPTITQPASGGGAPGSRPSNPSAAGSGGGGSRPVSPVAGAGTGGGGNAGKGGGRNTAPAGGGTAAPTVPAGLPTSGLRGGSGPVDVTVYMDLSDPADASTYLSVTTSLLARIAAGRSATITFSPIIVGSDSNAMEAAVAVLAGANQNRTWCVTGQIATLRSTRGGDWLNRSALRAMARSCRLSSTRFVRDATGNSLYPRLNDIREQARADGVGGTPSYVVKGNGRSQVLVNPGSADAVMSAISGAD